MHRQFSFGAAACALFGLASCAGAPAPEICEPLMSDVQAIGSHNSYKLAIPANELALLTAQSAEWGAALDYAHIRLFKQLNLGMRQLELDVFHDPDGGRYSDPLLPKMAGASFDNPALNHPGFKVLHVQDVDPRSSCDLFVECLIEIKAWSETNPDHAPLLVLINAKQAAIDLPGAVVPLPFDGAAFDALDAEIRSIFGENALLTPDDVRGSAPTLRDAVLSGGWPSLDGAWGNIFFALDEPEQVVDVYRRGETSLQGHAMFVNSSDPGADDAAYFTINDPIRDGAVIAERVQAGFIVRTRADANTMEARKGDDSRLNAALASGAQYISTDYYQPRREWSDYAAVLPEGKTMRVNPLAACAFP